MSCKDGGDNDNDDCTMSMASRRSVATDQFV